MRIVIAGGSRFSVDAAQSLLKRGIGNVTLVIEDKDDAMKASTELPKVTVVNASPSKPEVLSELDLDKCDVFVSATKTEEISILAGLYAKEHNVRRIYVKTTKEDTKMILAKLGMKAIDISESAANSIVLDIAEPLIYDLVGIGKGPLDIREKEVNDYPNLIGKIMGEVRGKFFNVISIYQEGKFYLAADTAIKENSSLIVLEESGQDEKVDKDLKKK
ncbi:MAG: NAD-binding protein [Nanoarchaeota archaeon]|nr:NAD-binding protein [Nanoarchaeota archaeon]MBU1004737.1 NAD-binding protein [Nanoarchaeota archaeon]MBU1945690.1 NAD-binding protein [Nanoarchaeota archaeon]